MDEARVQTAPGRAMRWWVVLPWGAGCLAYIGRVWSHWHDSDAWDSASPFGVVIVVTGVVMLWRGPGTVRARLAAGLFLAAGALLWFLDVNVDRSDPGQPHRGAWFALGLASAVAFFGMVVAAGALARSERALWQPSGFLGRR
ncbi:MAG: hypothetical protein HY830_15965 [Actinobacteria bacterium]|nr:hypothetical protein [Actinomycetota bacterium]